MLGYITTRHNDDKLLSFGAVHKTYKELKKDRAKEKLVEYGMPRWAATMSIKVAQHIETFVSLMMCTFMFLNYSLKYVRTNRLSFQGEKFFPKLNAQENIVKNLYGSIGMGTQDLTVIDIPEQYTKYKEFKTVSVFSGITYGQLWKSFITSLRLTCFVIRKYKSKDLLFRTYSSFPFFLCYFFVENLDNSNELIFYNHYDRWMYLFGNSHLRKTYVQHGKLWHDHIKRIKCDVAYYINANQREILEYTLFDNKPEAKYRKVFDYSGMDKLKDNHFKNLLIVCISTYSDQHTGVVKELYGGKVNIYLKPHPRDNMDIYNNLQKKYPEIVLLGKFDYPKVDYVLSYESTLADEYEMHDIPVLKYNDIDFKEKFDLLKNEFCS